jgi:lipid-binding SYLF domain-containing protein
MDRTRIVSLAISCLFVGVACASTPKSTAQRDALTTDAHNTVAMMTAADPGLQPLLDQAAGYVVFPDVKQGGFVVGASAGKGVLFEGGVPVGFAELRQASVGAQVGGQTFSELVVLKDRQALDRVKASKFAFGGQASAVAIKSGAASSARFESGVAVFVRPKGGAMLNVSVTGQRIKFTG